MLMTTDTGIVVNMAQVASVSLRQIEPEPTAITEEEKGKRHQVLVTLITGDFVVAARDLSREAAEFLRKDSAHHGAEGSRLDAVETGREQFQNGADSAQDAQTFARKGSLSGERDSRQDKELILRGEANTEKGT